MRKTILMGLGMALALAGTVAAQQAGQDTPQRPKAEGQRGAGGRFEGRGPGPRGLLFKDIALTDAQKAQLQTLRKTERDKMEASREQLKQQFEEARAARQRGDTAAARAIMLRNRQEMERSREQHIAAIRNILTAEQRTQFEKNVAELKQRQEKGDGRFGPRGERGAGPRGEKPGRLGR